MYESNEASPTFGAVRAEGIIRDKTPCESASGRLIDLQHQSDALLDQLEGALGKVLRSSPPSTDKSGPDEAPQSDFHGEMLGSCARQERIAARLADLRQRLTI